MFILTPDNVIPAAMTISITLPLGVRFVSLDNPCFLNITGPFGGVPSAFPPDPLCTAQGNVGQYFLVSNFNNPPLPCSAAYIYFTIQVQVDNLPIPDTCVSLTPSAILIPPPPACALTFNPMPDKVCCSYDPNDKKVFPEGCGQYGSVSRDEIANGLIYKIRFQNTGTAPAKNVVIRDTIDTDLNIETLTLLSTSHPYTKAEVLPGNVLVWTFDKINLPDSASDMNGSMGYVKYRIKPKAGLPDGTKITDRAAIYFDLNQPVITNTTLNTVKDTPYPVADFAATRSNNCNTMSYNFAYTGGTTGATFFWNFGADATPQTSTAQNPQGIIFASSGTKQLTLNVDLGGCISAITESLEVPNNKCGNNNSKVIICHLPPGNPNNGQTLCISPSAISAHLAHGDYCGPCISTAKLAKHSTEINETEDVFNIFPNPSTGTFTIEFTLNDASSPVIISVNNLLGETVYYSVNNYESEGTYSVEVSLKSADAANVQGMYFVNLKNGTKQFVKKIGLIKD